jgi:hypothetical protein
MIFASSSDWACISDPNRGVETGAFEPTRMKHSRWCLAWTALAAALGIPLGLPGAQAADASNPPPPLPPPDFLDSKPQLSDLLLKDKPVGRYMTGFPAIGYNQESKLTYGAIAQFYDNGPTNSPFFRYAPYRERLLVGATATTSGNASGFIGYDRPYIGDIPWRIRAGAAYTLTASENYFGIGQSTLGPLTYPGSTKQFHDLESYDDALSQKVNGQTWAAYNEYRRTDANGVLAVERDYLGGRLRPLIGLQFTHVEVHDYTGERIDNAVMQETRLRADYLAGDILGFGGGWDNAFKLGLTYDTRDFEPDPGAGVMLQISARLSTKALGSSFDYQQIAISGRGFCSLLPDPHRLVLAGRLTYALQFGDVPFYSEPIISATDGDFRGLGGYATLRGFAQNRFVGAAAAVANSELRWTIGETTLWKQHLRFMLVPFLDTGRVFDAARDTTLRDWKVDGGIGFRLAWNIATVVSFDYGASSEGSLFSMELGHQF